MYSQNRWALAASFWDTPGRKARAKEIAAKISGELSSCQNGTALEYGCGTGLVGMNLLEQFDEICFMDSSPAMVGVLEQKIAQSGAKNATALVANLVTDDVAKTFDCIYSSMVLHHITDVQSLLDTFYRMLPKNGKVCIVDLDEEDGTFHAEEKEFKGHNGFSHAQILSLLQNSGFHSTAVHTFYSNQKNVLGKMIPYSLFCATGTK